MRKLTAFLLCTLFIAHCCFAQTAALKGKVSDKYEKKSLANGSVLLLRQSDSVMVSFTRTGDDGSFTLKNLIAGKFLILVTRPAYADFVDRVEIRDSTGSVELEPIELIRKSQLLKEVVVNGKKGAIQIKGDTAEFTADSFHTQAGASVEDLLKKLPGIQIDRNGNITAQGQSVKRVLVDGEEFFGDDPTLVTQNLRADMVDKVQVYDKKSDQANFTGIDDGQKEKTINLKLKDSKKNGYFGRASAGEGTDGYYDYQLMLNDFRNKKKLAGYGIASNIGKAGLNWKEQSNYGQSGASNFDYDEASGYSYTQSASDDDLDTWQGQYGGQGLPSVKTAGVHYNDRSNDDRQSVNLNYKILQLNVVGDNSTSTQFILPDTVYYNNQTQHSNHQILRNRGSGVEEIKFDSTFSVKISADGGTDHKVIKDDSYSDARASDSSLVNSGTRNISNIIDNHTLNSNILFRKKLAKKGRTFSVNFTERYTNNASNGYLYADNNFYYKDTLTQNQIIDQYKNYTSHNLFLDGKATYSEPLSKSSYLVANYGASIDNSQSVKNSYNKGTDGKYSALDTTYSNDYQFNIFTNRGGLAYSLVKKKFRLSLGNTIGFTNFSQKEVNSNTESKRNFVNWYPTASFSITPASQTNIYFSYAGSTQQPTIHQIQPVLTNEDPLNVTIGNPGLKPQFGNQFYLYFQQFQVLTGRGIFANLNYNFTQNMISNNTTVDSTGKRTVQYVNLDGTRTLGANLDYNIKLKKPVLDVRFAGSINENRNVSMVNSLLNITNSETYQGAFSVTKSVDKKFELSVYSSAVYTTSQSSINTGIVTHYWTFSTYPWFDIFLPSKFQVHGELDASFRQKTSAFDKNINTGILNAWIGKKFMKNDALLIKLAGNDLLNQNIGFNRTVNSNFIAQNTYTTIKRYFMLSMVWNFTKPGTPQPRQ